MSEHRRWPTDDDEALSNHGAEALTVICEHFKNLISMESSKFNLEEAKVQYRRLKFEMRSQPFFSMNFKNFWRRIVTMYDDNLVGYPDFNIVMRVILMIVIDTSICETVYSKFNRIQTKARARLKVPTVDKVIMTQSHGPEIKDFAAGPIYDKWMDKPFDSEENKKGRGREISSMMRKIKTDIMSKGSCSEVKS